MPLEIRRFGGSPLFDGNGTMHTPPVDEKAEWPENLDFTSQSKETDKNWRDLLEDRFFSISEEEATEAWGEDRHKYVDQKNGGYTAGLDVFHSLHCLVCNITRGHHQKSTRSNRLPRTRYGWL